MGGLPSLGYDVNDKKLVVNEAEAETVRHIYRRYVVLDGIGDLLRDRIRLIEHLKPSDASPDRLKTLLLKAADLSDRITDSGPTEQRRILLAIVHRIEVRPGLIGIVVRGDALHATIGRSVPNAPAPQSHE